MFKKIFGILACCILIISSFGITTTKAALSGNVDQQQTSWNEGELIKNNDYGCSPYIIAQSFIPTKNNIYRVDAMLNKYDDAPGDLILSIRSSLTGSNLASASVTHDEVPEWPPAWISFEFAEITVTPGSTYYIVLQTEYVSGSDYYFWAVQWNTNPYANGNIFSYNGCTEEWVPYIIHDGANDYNADATFKTYYNTIPENNPPYTPSIPTPVNNAESVDTGIKLSWLGGDPDEDVVTYYVYINCAPEPDKVVNETGKTNPFEIISTIGTYHQIESKTVYLLPDQYYYWKVIVNDSSNHKTEGPTWIFHTKTISQCEPSDNIPPNKPSTPTLVYPPSILLHVGDTLMLKTKVIDPNGDNVNIYWDMNEDDVIDFERRNVTSNTDNIILYKWDSIPAGIYDIRVIATDLFYNNSQWSSPLTLYVKPSEGNLPPNNATIPSGTDLGYAKKEYTFTSYATDPNNEKIQYRWDFGDGTITEWSTLVNSGTIGYAGHHWEDEGNYDVKVQVRDINGAQQLKPWSDAKRVNIVKKATATIFNIDDFSGVTSGNEYDLLQGLGRQAYANGTTGAIVSSARAVFPGGAAWSQAGQGVSFYTGRPKQLTITAELSYVGGTDWMYPSYSCIEKLIKIDGWNNPKIEYREWLNNIATIEDFEAFSNGIMGLASQTTKNINVAKMIENIQKTQSYIDVMSVTDDCYEAYADDIFTKFEVSRSGELAKQYYIAAWEEQGGCGIQYTEGSISTTASESTTLKGTASISGILGAISLIVTISWEVYIYYRLMTNWQIDTLLKEYENKGTASTETISKSYTFNEPGNHTVWTGIESVAGGIGITPAYAYAAGKVRSITIDGIAPPEKPTIGDPKPRPGIKYYFKPYAIDQNQDPIQYIIYWGDGTTTTTGFYNYPDYEGSVPHTYKQGGLYNITLKAKDCDKMESDYATYQVDVNPNNPRPYPYTESESSSTSSSSSSSSTQTQQSTTTQQQVLTGSSQQLLLNQLLYQTLIQQTTR